MQKTILAAAAFACIALTGIGAKAQSTNPANEKKAEPTTTTIDAWRQAVPQSEQPAYVPPPKSEDGLKNDPDRAETPAEIEAVILELEARFMESLKQRDAKTLRSLLSNDFVFAGINAPGAQTDKMRFIDWAQKKFALKSYSLERPVVHSYATSAVVTYNYKRQASIGDSSSDGDFAVTDVWVKSGNRWQAVSHHISPLQKQ